MSILNKYKKPDFFLPIIRDRYWDFCLSRSGSVGVDISSSNTENCLSAFIDFSLDECIENGNAVSLSSYTWNESVNEGVELKNIGLTGMDNGIISFDKDTITDIDFYNRLTKSRLQIESGDTRLVLRPVDGNTKAYCYPICYHDDYVSLMGGFYQGFFKLEGEKYQTLPQYIDDAMEFEFTLRPMSYVTVKNTLNSFYPDNRGIFFYIGTRSENKFAKMYGCDLSMYPDRKLSAETTCYDYFSDDYFVFDKKCEKLVIQGGEYGDYFTDVYMDTGDTLYMKTDLDSGETFDLSAQTITDSDGQVLEKDRYTQIETDNKYLFFNRTCSGYTTRTWDEEAKAVVSYRKTKTNLNLYLLVNRTCSGLTARDLLKIDEDDYIFDAAENRIRPRTPNDPPVNNYDIVNDLTSNAFALRINENYGISYRYLIRDCDAENGFSIEEESTLGGIVPEGVWSNIHVKFKILNGGLDECGMPIGKRKMKIYIYVDGYLRFISKELPELDLRPLADSKERQETVPYCISLGGGTQGLSESIWLKYKEMFPKVLPLEENFAGSFIGDIRDFKVYTCSLQYNQIKNNWLYEKAKQN